MIISPSIDLQAHKDSFATDIERQTQIFFHFSSIIKRQIRQTNSTISKVKVNEFIQTHG